MTERNCMRVVGKSSELNPLTPSGRRSTKNGPRDQQRNFPSGSVRDPARKPEMLKPQRVRKKVVRKPLQRRKTMKKKRRRKKKRKRRKSKHYSRKPFLICNVWPDFSSQQVPDEHSCQEQSSLSMKMDFKSNEGQSLLVFDLSFVVICDFPVAT